MSPAPSLRLRCGRRLFVKRCETNRSGTASQPTRSPPLSRYLLGTPATLATLIINTLQKTLLVESRNTARYSQTCRFSQRSVRINWRQSAQWAALSLTTPMRATSAGPASKRSEQLWRSRDSHETKSDDSPNVRPVALIPILLIRGILETWTSL